MDPINENSKRCKQCGGVKLVTEFYRSRQCLYGRRGECKKCTNKYGAAWRRAKYQRKTDRPYRRGEASPTAAARKRRKELGPRRERWQREIDTGEKTCHKCGAAKPLSAYRTNPNNGFPRATCRACEIEQFRVYNKRARAKRKAEASRVQVAQG